MEVTRRDLEQLRGLQFELESLRRLRPKNQEVVIFYKDYRSGRGIPKTDVGYDEGENMAEEIAGKIRRKQNQILRRISKVEDWLDSVQDPLMRTILRYYYVSGKTQQQIGELVGYSRERVGKKIQAFWIEQELDHNDQK